MLFFTKILKTPYIHCSVVHPCYTRRTFRRSIKQLSTCYSHNSIILIWFWSHEPWFSSSHCGSLQINMAFDCISCKNALSGSLHYPAKHKASRLLRPSTALFLVSPSTQSIWLAIIILPFRAKAVFVHFLILFLMSASDADYMSSFWKE